MSKILDCIIADTLGGIADYIEAYDKYFDRLGIDPSEFNWGLSGMVDIEDKEQIRYFCLDRLIFAAQMNGFLHDSVVACYMIDHNGVITYEPFFEPPKDVVESIHRFADLIGEVIEIKWT